MHKIVVVGLGPGHPDHITPAALRALRGCAVMIGGRRALAALGPDAVPGVERRTLGADLEELAASCAEERAARRIGVIASGDPCFYGILSVLRARLGGEAIEVVPGIGSIPFFFSRLGMSWEGACLGSLHGRETDIVATVRGHRLAAFLTDAAHPYPLVARTLADAGLGGRMMYVGINLSYDDERIVRGRVSDCATHDCDEPLCVMVIADE